MTRLERLIEAANPELVPATTTAPVEVRLDDLQAAVEILQGVWAVTKNETMDEE